MVMKNLAKLWNFKTAISMARKFWKKCINPESFGKVMFHNFLVKIELCLIMS